MTHQSQATFFQVRVDEKTNEIPVAKQVLPSLPIRQRVCTADALHPHARYQQAQTIDRHRGRTVTKAGLTTTEVVYLTTTLTPGKAGPERLLELNRGHWSIENRSHYVRDVSFGEDRSRLRTGNAPHIMAALRNLAISLIHRFGSCHIKATRRHLASCPREALALLSSPAGGQQYFTDPASSLYVVLKSGNSVAG